MRARVRIHPPREEDRTEFLTAARRSRELHRPWIYPPRTEEAYDAWLERQATAEFSGNLIVSADDGRLAGFCNLSQIIRGNLNGAFIGFAGFSGSEGRGLVREGVGLVLDEAFGSLRLHRVEANVQPENGASLRLLERLGFVREGFSPSYLKVGGRWRDHERWAIRDGIRANRS